jgi:hypothetical protein
VIHGRELIPLCAILARAAADSNRDISTLCIVFAIDSIGFAKVSKVFMEAIAAS